MRFRAQNVKFMILKRKTPQKTGPMCTMGHSKLLNVKQHLSKKLFFFVMHYTFYVSKYLFDKIKNDSAEQFRHIDYNRVHKKHENKRT